MSDLLNNYTKCHDEFIDMIVKYYPLHEKWLDRQSPQRTMDLRKVYKEMRIAIKKMEEVAQLRMKERSVEWRNAHPGKKETKE